MNIGWMLQPGETGIDPEWASRDDALVVAGDVEHWLHDLTMHNTKPREIARGIVESSRQRR